MIEIIFKGNKRTRHSNPQKATNHLFTTLLGALQLFILAEVLCFQITQQINQ